MNWTTKTIEGVAFQEAVLGDYYGGDGVRFTLEHYSTCYRRGPWKLLIEICGGPGHRLWGCLDLDDAPLRWFHSEQNAKSEADLISLVLFADRQKAEKPKL